MKTIGDKKFYFTYGSEGHPFPGGWTLVKALDREMACAIFRAFHPDHIPGLVNCCGIYGEDEFKKSKMYTNGNLGHRCWEELSATRKLRGFDDD